jgi:predicted hydrocarbon binding protein
MTTSNQTNRAGGRRLIVPALPLALLEAVRDSDRPGEVLEDEDLSVSLPRRLGLTGVVDTQIRRYESARQWQRSVPQEDLFNLLRLVLRRPDAAAILVDAGHRIARRRFEKLSGPSRIGLRALPRAASLAVIRRASMRLFRAISGEERVENHGRPLALRLEQPELARLDAVGTSCRLYTGVLEEMALLYGRRPVAVVHSQCMALGHHYCEWRIEE